MQDYIDDAEETLSLSNFLMKEDDSEVQPSKPVHTSSSSMSSSSSSSPSLSEQDFLGFFSEEWSKNNISAENNIVFCGKVVASGQPVVGDRKPAGTKSQTNPLFRSNSDSFRFIRMKSGSNKPTIPSRSKSLPNRSAAAFPCKSRLMVFMFGSGSTKFPTKVDMNDIKSRQLRQQSTTTSVVPDGGVNHNNEESGGRKSGNKGWWRVVDVLGCGGGGYERDTVAVSTCH